MSSASEDWGGADTDDTAPQRTRYASGNDDDSNEDVDYSMIMSYPAEEEDYYALLGLRRDPAPNDAEIRSAYRILTLSFHPDKQPAELREAAERHFAKIQEAYETLLDPKKRVVYDLLGAEGVRREWGAGGAMGRGGEAEMQIGVRAQTPEEFRGWFLETMKRRERRVLNSLVQSRGSLTLGVDASNMIEVDEDAGEVYIHIPSPSLSSYAIRYSFKAPLPTREVLLGEEEAEDEDEDEAPDGRSSPQKVHSYLEAQGPEITFNAGISGNLRRSFRKMQFQIEDEGIVTRAVPLPMFIAGRDISLGAGISHRFGDIASMKGILAKRPFAFLRDSAFALNAAVLPTPLLQGTIATAVQPIPGTKPFQVNTSAIITNSLLKTPPMLALQVTKEIGERKHAFCSWSSGTISWPKVLQVLFSPIANLGLDTESAMEMTAFVQQSQFQLGFLSLPKQNRNTIVLGDDEDQAAEEEEDEEEAELRQIRKKARSEANAAESWQTVVTASPEEAGLSFTYARNIFNGKAASELSRSEWSSEGHYSLPPASEPRSVRVEVRSSMNIDLSLAWNISGTRQVGRFTRVGFGVGVQGGRGLVMTASWSRLGQKITLPVAVCPMDAVNADAAALAVIFPWVAYCALEFGYIRPRERRQRRRAIARRHKQLKRLIPKRKAESQQAVELMAEHVHRRQAREEAQGGLVITKAEYGHYPSPKRWTNDNANVAKDLEIADVTIPVAALVDHGQLVITKDTVKFQILGFHDPAPLLPKKLKIWYTYRGKEHFVEANDSEGIACPMRTHLLD
ncbi:J domain-containing protein [Aspergillus udagawae]|uniref:J domain-containing protein n=1 Tax=Aspergillus udagawae TaxID=91492 RepID=A0A8E0QWH4_9EURO|nr:uncharacterized protein Aud_006508 [Aspergillus udagawae]GIC90076.1 hypothetical protein Aud_006508 [Aspergillus udagawae]